MESTVASCRFFNEAFLGWICRENLLVGHLIALQLMIRRVSVLLLHVASAPFSLPLKRLRVSLGCWTGSTGRFLCLTDVSLPTRTCPKVENGGWSYSTMFSITNEKHGRPVNEKFRFFNTQVQLAGRQRSLLSSSH